MVRKHNIIIPALVAGILAGCSGGSTTPGASGTAPVLAATTGSATSYTSAKWGGGGYVTGIIYHPTSWQVMYARTDVGGLYRWNNSGGSWTPITDGIGFNGGESTYHGIESVALDPTNDNKIYMATGMYSHDYQGTPINGRLYVSGDRGNSWTHYDLPFPVGGNENARAIGERLQIDPSNPSKLFFASRTAGLWVSTNAGQTWTQTSLSSKVLSASEILSLSQNGAAPVGVEQVMIDSSSNIYAAIAPDYVQKAGLTSTLYKSTNGGASWAPVAVPSTVSGYYVPHFARSSDGYFYVVFNQNAGQGAQGPGYVYKFGGPAHGETWAQLATTTQGGFGGVSVSGSGATTRVVVAETGIWSANPPAVMLSDSAGAPGTWREIAGGMQHWGGGYSGWVDDVKIDPNLPDHIMHVTGGGVWETWGASQAAPSWDAPVNNLEEVCPNAVVTPPVGASYQFIQASGDVGTWLQTDLAAKPTKGPTSEWSNGYAVDVLWSNSNFIVSAGTLNKDGVNKVPFGAWSSDGGTTWSNFATVPAGLSDHSSQSIVATSSSNIVWAIPNSVAYWSTNNGASWTATNLPALPGVGIDRGYHLAADRRNPNKVYAYDSGGASWNNTTGKVYVSTDGGHNFTLSQGSVTANLAPNGFLSTSLVVNPNVEGDLWLADGNAVYHSTDSGASWTKLAGFASVAGSGSTGQLAGASNIALGKVQTGGTYSAEVYVVGTRNGVWGIYHSNDAGATWVRYNDDAHQYGGIFSIAADWNTYGRIYFSGTGRGVIYTN